MRTECELNSAVRPNRRSELLCPLIARALLKLGCLLPGEALNTGVCKAAYHSNSGRSLQRCVFSIRNMPLPIASYNTYVRPFEDLMCPNGTKANRPARPRSGRACASQRAASEAPEILMAGIKFRTYWAFERISTHSAQLKLSTKRRAKQGQNEARSS